MGFRLVPKSMTLDDLEGSLCTLFQYTCVFGVHQENLNEGRLDPYYQRQAITIVSGNIRFTQTFAGVLRRRGVKRQCGNRKRRSPQINGISSNGIIE